MLDEILNYIGLDINSISLKINYISSKYQIPYAGLYSEKYNMFFEDEREAQLYEENEKSDEISELADSNEDYIITPTDLAITTKKAKNTLVQKFKNIFEKIRDMWR